MSSSSRTSDQNLDFTDNSANRPTGHKPDHLSRTLWIRWSIYTILGVFCVYRLAVFRPQPLDAPGTLRPILYAIFHWFVGLSGTPDEAFAKWSTICSLVLLVPPALALLNYGRLHGLVKLPSRAGHLLCSRWLFFTSVTACLVLCRYPTLLQNEFNPDEGAFIAAASKLFYDPNYFHSVDCQTNGPLNIYPLMLPAILGLSPDFASSRALVIVIVVLCSFLFYRTIASIAPEDLARLSVLPFTGAMAVLKNTELRHYSSEYVPLLLISIALYLSVRVLRNPAKYQTSIVSLGMLSTAAFFSKLQSVPIVVSLVVVALAYVYITGHAAKWWRPALLFLAGTIPLMLINAVMCLTGGVWKDFWISYIRANVSYADAGKGGFITNLRTFTEFVLETHEIRFFVFTVAALGLAYFIERFRRRRARSQDMLFLMVTAMSAIIAAEITLQPLDGWTIYTYLVLVAICMVPMYFVVLYGSKSLSLKPVAWFGFLALISSCAAIFSIYRAHRPFRHYLLFLFLPLSAAMAWMLIRQASPLAGKDLAPWKRRPVSSRTPRGLSFIALLLVLTFAYQSYAWNFQDDEFFKNAVASFRSDEGEFVRSVTNPGATVFVWGWNSVPFLGSGRVTATRDLQVVNCFRNYDVGTYPPSLSPTRQSRDISEYYLTRIVHDLRANPPELFVDSMSIASWFINDRRYFGFEQFPDLDHFVKGNYVLLTERNEPGARGGLGLERFYMRRDVVAKWIPVRLQKTCAPHALRCFGLPASTSPLATVSFSAHTLPAIQIPAHALMEAEFIPIGSQVENATILNNEAVPRSFRGFRFQSIGGDRYRLLVGLGNKWAFSKSLLLPTGKPAALSVEFDSNNVYLRSNGVAVDDMHLSSPMADATGPITLGSWIDGQCRFSGAISSFQIVDLGAARQNSAGPGTRHSVVRR